MVLLLTKGLICRFVMQNLLTFMSFFYVGKVESILLSYQAPKENLETNGEGLLGAKPYFASEKKQDTIYFFQEENDYYAKAEWIGLRR